MMQPPRDWENPRYRMGAFIRIVGDHLPAPDRDDPRAVRVVMARLARDRRRWDRPAPKPVVAATRDNPHINPTEYAARMADPVPGDASTTP